MIDLAMASSAAQPDPPVLDGEIQCDPAPPDEFQEAASRAEWKHKLDMEQVLQDDLQRTMEENLAAERAAAGLRVKPICKADLPKSPFAPTRRSPSLTLVSRNRWTQDD